MRNLSRQIYCRNLCRIVEKCGLKSVFHESATLHENGFVAAKIQLCDDNSMPTFVNDQCN